MSDRSERRFEISSAAGTYEVVIGRGAITTVAGSGVAIVDSAVAHAVAGLREESTVVVEAQEQTKTLAGCEDVILRMHAAGVRRGEAVLAVGGGVVQDLATFATSVYMRGVPWVFAPTTLTAMADSCIGGKSSINVGAVKNLAGGFHPPSRIIIDTSFLDTLPSEAISAGLAEAAKICFCKGSDSFARYLALHQGFRQSPEALLEHVLLAKKWFVEIDEHDRAERLQLNFGHTFGHALEKATGHALSHGLGVAVGILCALRHPDASLSERTGELERHCWDLLAGQPQVAVALTRADLSVFEAAFRSDKKHSHAHFRLILPAAGQGVRIVEVSSDDDGWRSISGAVRQVLQEIEEKA